MAALSPLSDIGFVTININNLKIEFLFKGSSEHQTIGEGDNFLLDVMMAPQVIDFC